MPVTVKEGWQEKRQGYVKNDNSKWGQNSGGREKAGESAAEFGRWDEVAQRTEMTFLGLAPF